jgi:hypothetical protein
MHCNEIGSFNGIVLVVPNLRQHLFGMSSRFRFSLSRFCGSISKRPNPDVALNHMRDLAVDHLTPNNQDELYIPDSSKISLSADHLATRVSITLAAS